MPNWLRQMRSSVSGSFPFLGDLFHPDMGDWNGSDKAEADRDREGEQVESHPSGQNSGNGTLNKYDELLLAAL